MDNHTFYYLIISLLSNKLWDFLFFTIDIIFNFILWEIRTVTNNGCIDSDLFVNSLISTISDSCYICSGGRILYNNNLIPLGYSICKGFSIIRVSENFSNISSNNYESNSKKILVIKLYGWWTIKNLVNNNNNKHTIRSGKYKMYYYNGKYYSKHFDNNIKLIDFPDCFYHKNSSIGAQYIYNSVLNTYNKSGVYLLTGLTGLGKTNTGMYLSKLFQYNATICNDFSIFLQSSNMSSLSMKIKDISTEIEISDDNFLICIMDEVDEIINNIYNKSNCKDDPDNKMNKRMWNYFLEQVHLYPNVILIMTSNQNIEFFNNLDPSFMREYRVTKIYNYTENGVDEVNNSMSSSSFS